MMEESNSRNNNQKNPSRYQNKASSRGGVRLGAGRPKGTINKIGPEELARDFRKSSGGQTFSQFINKKIIEADQNGDKELVAKLILGLSKYYISDTQQIDITSNGENIMPQIVFTACELEEWRKKEP